MLFNLQALSRFWQLNIYNDCPLVDLYESMPLAIPGSRCNSLGSDMFHTTTVFPALNRRWIPNCCRGLVVMMCGTSHT